MLTIKGMQKKTITVDEGNVTITIGGHIFGAQRDKVIPIRSIAGVDVKKPGPIINGYIQIQLAGQASGNAMFKYTGGAYDAASDENAVIFTKRDYDTALKMQQYILSYGSQPSVSQPTSGADEISKYKRLMDDGTITPEEFEAKKRQLLGI